MGMTVLHLQAEERVVLLPPPVVVDSLSAPLVVSPKESSVTTVTTLAKPQWWRWLLAISAAAFEAILGLMLPGAISRVLGAESLGDYGALAALLVGRAVMVWVAGTQVRAACEYLGENLRAALYEAMLARDVQDYDDGSAVERWTLVNNDVREYKAAVGKLVSDGVPAVVTVVGGSYILFNTSPLLTTLLGVSAPLVMGFGAWWARNLKANLQRARELEAQSVAEAGEVLQHIRTVRIYATEPEELRAHELKLKQITSEYTTLHRYLVAFQAASSIALTGISAGSLFFGQYLMGNQALSSKDLTAYLMGALRLQGAVGTLSLLTSESLRVLPTCGGRILEVINHVPRIPLRGGKQLTLDHSGVEIEWHNVDFAYRPGEPVLRHLNLHIKPGESVAFVGKSGAGKTTLASILLRLYDVNSGAVLFDNIPVTELDARQLRRKVVGFVEQRPTLRPGTVRDNILYGSSSGDVESAAKAAFAHDFISALPQGYDTPVTDSTLSGGQLARVAIARALVKSPEILVLDEPTAALDSESEEAIQRCIQRMASDGKVVIVIAHKLSTVRACSRVVVLSDGSIAAMGTHEQLIRQRGLYQNLFQKNAD